MKKNLAISFVAFCLLYALLEWTFFYWFPQVFPTNAAMMATDEGVHPILQSSKKSVVPENYIGLLGDSYAQGMGDWATQEMSKPMARYGSANLLHEMTGRDVISFGAAGAGSVRGIITEPTSQLAYIKQYVSAAFPDPELILVYFYEGNDLYDNAAYFHYSFPHFFDVKQQYDLNVYQQYLQKIAIERDDTWKLAQRNEWLRHFPFAVFLEKIMRTVLGVAQRQEPNEPLEESLDPPWIFGGASYKEPGTINHALIGGVTVQLPDQLQGPAMNLDSEEWRQAWFAFEQALLFSRKKFPDSQFILVYIPSVISCYTLTSDSVSMQSYERREGTFSSDRVDTKSLQMREAIKIIAQNQSISLIDTTEAMKNRAKQHTLHGPKDWNHLNQYGYQSLSAAISNELRFILMAKEPVQNE